MKIFLFYSDKIYKYILPKEIEGSYGFDVDKNETSKLINVEARDGHWVIFSVEGTELYQNNSLVTNAVLSEDAFFIVGKRGQRFLIYVQSIINDKVSVYYYEQLNIVVGNTNNSNVRYACPYLNQNEIKIVKHDNNFLLEQTQVGLVYINDYILKENKCFLKNGDSVNIYGFKIIILNGLVLTNNPRNKISINPSSGLNFYSIPADESTRNVVFQDKELYDKSDYFSKAPRIRRIIENKEIKLSPPPSSQDSPEMPFILTIGPMLTMGMMAFMNVINVVNRIMSGETTLGKSWPQIITAIAMLASMVLWPMISRNYSKKIAEKRRKELIEKYDGYLVKKEKEIQDEEHLQKEILNENLITVSECLNLIRKRNIGFWDKRVDQNDFLVVRFGMGKQPLDVNISYQEQDFNVDEDELREKADRLKERYKYINNVPVSYSFYDNKISAIMGFDKKKSFEFANNVLLQLLTFYSYEDLKIVVFSNEKNAYNWDYIKYLNHNFNNERTFRFFASNQDSAKLVMGYLENVMRSRMGSKSSTPAKPHYLIIIDDYDSVKRFDFIGELTEADENLGFSIIILEEKLNKLPSKCNNFISLTNSSGSILKNSYEKQEIIIFKDEIDSGVNMLGVSKVMSNIPIEFEEGVKNLPDSISFLEMHEVGKVEQLSILNRWSTNDSTMSLRAEIGVDDQGDSMYLDLHEKYHGPHGLIAGTTGSGKSEFIITYILSMCINYSPDDVAFILIDYKGGGLALAFENKNIGMRLPHLAGTITNLDKAEMDRTLVSIDSEVKRRQKIFNEARDKLNESTIDIYKYQRFYKEGRLDEPIPHLFIICDEFAELKVQQPDFMDNLISVARIGRSLGVHLILATQKPSGVVNDQIWSNTKFRVCLKVQDENDSKEMLKKPDAAYIKQVGRFYLQVGYDEIYMLGQSGWCGAKYYPSNKIVKQVDKSINFISDCGQFIKSIQASGGSKKEAQGEQLQAVLKLIIDVASRVHKQARRLWLENIPAVIIEEEIEKKYGFKKEPFKYEAVIGEYDAPELQEQGIVKYDLLKDGNSIVYGNDSIEREMFLNMVIYSLSKNYTPEEVNFYMLDFGSESLKIYEKMPHFGGIATVSEENRVTNLINIITEEIARRKRKFADYGGEYEKYIKNSGKKLPLLVVMINNFDTMKDNYDGLIYGSLPDAIRDSDRYGIVYIITASGANSVRMNIQQNCKTFFAFKLKDKYEYQGVFSKKSNLIPRDILGRGMIDNGELHEFQVSYIVNPEQSDDYVRKYVLEMKEKYKGYKPYLPLPILPEKVRIENVFGYLTNLRNVPVGISKDTVDIQYVDFITNMGTIVSSTKLETTIPFVKSLLNLVKNISGINILVIDPKSLLGLNKSEFPNYYTNNLKDVVKAITEYVDRLVDSGSTKEGLLVFYGIDEIMKSFDDQTMLDALTMAVKKYEKIGILFAESNNKYKGITFNKWIKNVLSTGNGIWVGNGVSNQSVIMCSTNRAMQAKIKDDLGYVISDGTAELGKLLDFYTEEE